MRLEKEKLRRILWKSCETIASLAGVKTDNQNSKETIHSTWWRLYFARKETDRDGLIKISLSEDGPSIELREPENDGRKLQEYKLLTIEGEQDNAANLSQFSFELNLSRNNAKRWLVMHDVHCPAQGIIEHLQELSGQESTSKEVFDRRKETRRKAKKRGISAPSEDEFRLEIEDQDFAAPISLMYFFLFWGAKFKRCRFRGALSLEKIKTLNAVSFEDCIFDGDVSFRDARIDGSFEMKNCFFGRNSDFANLNVAGRFSLIGSVFSDGFFGPSMKLVGNCFIENNLFLGNNANFSETRVGIDLMFKQNYFAQKIWMYDAELRRGAYFSHNLFSDECSLTSSKFHSSVLWMYNKHFGDFDFANADVARSMSMAGTNFHDLPPKLLGTELPDDFEWAPMGYWADPSEFDVKTRQSAFPRYSALRRKHSSRGDFADQHFFYRKELACRVIDGEFFERKILSVFRALSNFGWSMTRPLLGMVFNVVFHACIFAAYFSNFLEGFSLSLANQFSFLGLNRFLADEQLNGLEGSSGELFVGFQIFVGYALWGLLLLSIANRVRMK